MQKLQKKKKALALFTSFLLLSFTILTAIRVRADSVTDRLKICVGYSGMDLTEYVTVKDYHWSELEANLPIVEEAYSYFNKGSKDSEYVAIVDAARGFLISDLLSYSNIYYGDIYNILFYVVDAQGIWTAFDKDELFGTRYYFNDLAGNRTVIYGTKMADVQVGEREITELVQKTDPETGEPLFDPETGEPIMEEVVVGTEPVYEKQEVTDYTKIKGYKFDQAWNDYQTVEPMLAFEDNWASFNQEFEHIGPDFDNMSTGSRFRLLFGQKTPTETMTRESAKYVSRLYITLAGEPKLGDMPESLDSTLGAHEITLTVKDAYNKDMRDALSEYLKLNSTNESVLRIDGIRIEGTSYSDVASVTISYTIVGEGTASIQASVGGKALKTSGGKTMDQLTEVIVEATEEETENTPSSESRENGSENGSGNGSADSSENSSGNGSENSTDKDGNGSAGPVTPSESTESSEAAGAGENEGAESKTEASNPETGNKTDKSDESGSANESSNANESNKDELPEQSEGPASSEAPVESSQDQETVNASEPGDRPSRNPSAETSLNGETGKKPAQETLSRESKEAKVEETMKESIKETSQKSPEEELKPDQALESPASLVIEKEMTGNAEISNASNGSQKVIGYALSEEAASKLGGKSDLMGAALVEVKPDREITEVKVEEAEEDKNLMLYTLLTLAAIMACGGIFEAVSFRHRL